MSWEQGSCSCWTKRLKQLDSKHQSPHWQDVEVSGGKAMGQAGGQQLPGKTWKCRQALVPDNGSKARLHSRKLPQTPPQLHDSGCVQSREPQRKNGLPPGEDDRVRKTVSPHSPLPEAIRAGLISTLK